jgi:hypothetical protein
VSDLAELLHEISVAFAASGNLRTLLPRLGEGMARHLPVVELEAAMLDRDGGAVVIAAYAPTSGRSWTGRRSPRFLERQGVHSAAWSQDPEPARVALDPVEARLKVAAGRIGLLSIGFETEISVDREGSKDTDIMVEVLMAHCTRLAQLDACARRCRLANRNIVGTKMEKTAEPDLRPSKKTDISVSMEETPNTEISVTTLDVAITQCISAALRVTHGQIYGNAGAAKLLGLKPSTLQSKMRKFGIERSDFVREE